MKNTAARPSPATGMPMVGAPGRVAGTTPTPADAGPVPAAFLAVTEQLYTVPLTSPDRLIGELAPGAETAPGLHVAV